MTENVHEPVTCRSVVNAWDCDQMGHMNVRFYIASAGIATASAWCLLGLGPQTLASRGWRLRTRDQHVRFLKELRAGAGFYIESRVVAVTDTALQLCHQLRRSSDHSLSATITGNVELCTEQDFSPVSLPAELSRRAEAMLLPLPDAASPRGLSASLPEQLPSQPLADRYGLSEIYRGQIEAMQCDRSGVMQDWNVIAAISDGIPNWFPEDRGEDNTELSRRRIGGAAVEYRIRYLRSVRCGSLLSIRSGMVAVGHKTLQHAHWLLDLETGEAVATAEAMAVVFDLVERRAIAVPESVRPRYLDLLTPGLTSP